MLVYVCFKTYRVAIPVNKNQTGTLEKGVMRFDATKVN